MCVHASVLVSVLCCVASLQCTGAIRHHILTKSWDEAQDDCLAYLRFDANSTAHYRAHQYGEDARTMELVFCIALNLRAYEPSRNAVRVEVLGRFFQPDHDDRRYVERTNQCLRGVVIPPATNWWSEFYATATEMVYGTFRCFYLHYGNLNRNAPQLPPTALEMAQVQQECAQIVHLPLVLLRNRPRARVHPVYDRFRRCVALRTGVCDWELDDSLAVDMLDREDEDSQEQEEEEENDGAFMHMKGTRY